MREGDDEEKAKDYAEARRRRTITGIVIAGGCLILIALYPEHLWPLSAVAFMAGGIVTPPPFMTNFFGKGGSK